MDEPKINETPIPADQMEEINETVRINGQEYKVLKGVEQNCNVKFNRVTVMENIYHENDDGPHQLYDKPFEYPLESDEQAYTRIMKVGPEWIKVPYGWLEDTGVSTLHLANLEGRHAKQVRPTDEEKKESYSRVVEVCVHGSLYSEGRNVPIPCGYISPRRSIRLEVGTSSHVTLTYYVRSMNGPVKLQVTALPV